MVGMSTVSIALTIVTAVASILSVIGSAFILVCYTILPLDYHFRHVLILNLATSDFLNSLNNSVAGLYILAKGEGLRPGPACVFNGMVGQVTVQATDCAVLAIAISTVLAITRREPITSIHQGAWQTNQIVLVCCAIWALPFFTGFLALGMGWYSPATGNWCWLKAKPVYLRYVLTHGWRMLFIVVEICLYICLDRHLRRHYRALAAEMPGTQNGLTYTTLSEPHPHSSIRFDVESPPSAMDVVKVEITKIGEKGIVGDEPDGVGLLLRQAATSFTPKPEDKDPIPPQQEESSGVGTWSLSQITGLRGTHSFSLDNRYQTIQRALLLNAYPLAYIILLLPGIANRLVEATGHSSKIAQFMQASTQLVGLANALTYGWNERVARQLRERFRTWSR